MFCPQCGTQVADTCKFCVACGAKLANGYTAPAAPAPNTGYAPAPNAGYAPAANAGYAPAAGYGAAPGYAPGYAPAPAPVAPNTKEGWMLAAVRDAIASGLKDPMSARFGNFENIEIDAYGRTYAEIVVHATNSYGAYVPTRYAVGFFDVTDYAPCTVIPKSLFMLPAVMVGAQRKVAKKMIRFGQPR